MKIFICLWCLFISCSQVMGENRNDESLEITFKNSRHNSNYFSLNIEKKYTHVNGTNNFFLKPFYPKCRPFLKQSITVAELHKTFRIKKKTFTNNKKCKYALKKIELVLLQTSINNFINFQSENTFLYRDHIIPGSFMNQHFSFYLKNSKSEYKNKLKIECDIKKIIVNDRIKLKDYCQKRLQYITSDNLEFNLDIDSYDVFKHYGLDFL